MKVEFDRLEAAWARQPGETLVTDEHGVVTITSRPAWRFHALRPVDAAVRAAVRRSLQCGRLSLTPIGLRGDGRSVQGPGRRKYAVMSTPQDGATLRFFQPLGPFWSSAARWARVVLVGTAALLTAILLLLLRARERTMMRAAARRELQEEVVRRTAELHDANLQLTVQAAESERLNARHREARKERTRAKRLGTLGQVTAGVAHEINQPVVSDAIRLEQIIVNLLQNVADAVSESDQPTVDIWVAAAPDSRRLIVCDNGPGAAVTCDGIFEPFVTGRSGGLGLGLPIAREFGGELELTRTGPDGSVFTLFLRCA